MKYEVELAGKKQVIELLDSELALILAIKELANEIRKLRSLKK